MKILWLASWYPSRIEPFNGDFVQRHAEAASLHDDITVIHVIKDLQGALTKNVLVEEEKKGRLTEKIIYYHEQRPPALNSAFSGLRYYMVFRQQANQYIERHGKPDLVHVHVPWKAGLIALWLKRKHKVPFLVTEHWGIYNTVVEDNVYKRSFFFRFLLKTIYQNAGRFVSVSRFLGEAVNNTVVRKKFTVIPNVVNTAFFHPAEKATCFTFLHVSNMVPLKNVEGILAAFHSFLQQTGADARLVLVGNKDARHAQLAAERGLLNTAVFVRGEIPYADVGREMQKAHVLVLNSNMENSPCVIGEALCCGLPVIATRVGGIPELVGEGNGLLVPPQDERLLAEAMATVFRHFESFDAEAIAVDARKKFAMEPIGREFHQLYATFL